MFSELWPLAGSANRVRELSGRRLPGANRPSRAGRAHAGARAFNSGARGRAHQSPPPSRGLGYSSRLLPGRPEFVAHVAGRAGHDCQSIAAHPGGTRAPSASPTQHRWPAIARPTERGRNNPTPDSPTEPHPIRSRAFPLTRAVALVSQRTPLALLASRGSRASHTFARTADGRRAQRPIAGSARHASVARVARSGARRARTVTRCISRLRRVRSAALWYGEHVPAAAMRLACCSRWC
jgi:hypothetical protein